MISFRYHVVSIMAVFLALGLGIMLGSSVVSDAVDAELRDDLTTVRQDRNEARRERALALEELDQLRELVAEQVAPWGIAGRLDGASVLVVTDGPDIPAWRDHVDGAIAAAGASVEGALSFTAKWALDEPQDQAQLVEAVRAGIPGFEPGADPAASAFESLGETLLRPGGPALVDALENAGFLLVRDRPEGVWPSPSSLVVILSPSRRAESAVLAGGASFVPAVAATAPTLVVTDQPQGRSLVSEARQLPGDERPDSLSTFDSATGEDDPGGTAVVAALLAAVEGRGDDYGADGERFIAPVSSQQ